MTNKRRNLAVSIQTPGGDDPLRLSLVASGPYYRGVPVSHLALVARGGTAPYAYSILATSSNDLPPGLSLPSPLQGEITGTPTQAGRYTFIAQVADSNSQVVKHSFTIDILAQLFWLGPPPPKGELTLAYNYQFRVRDASGVQLTSGFTYTGTIPAGLTLHANGIVDGTPTAPFGISYFTVHATDGTDTIDIPTSIEIVDYVGGYYTEDRDPPNGWGGGAGTWLPSIVRGQNWIAHLNITGGVPPYSIRPSDVNPPPSGIKVIQQQRIVAGATMDAAQPDPVLLSVFVYDALGAQFTVQRAAFILDTQQGRIQPQRNSVDAVGGSGATKWNFVEGSNVTISISNDGDTADIEIAASGTGGGGGISTINTVHPDTHGNIQITGIHEDSNGDLVVDATSYTPPLTTKGDLFGFSTLPARFPVGANALPIVADSTQALGIKYGVLSIPGGGTGQTTASAAFAALSPQTTKGDLIAYSTLPVRFGVGANGTILYADSGQASGWNTGAPGGDLTGTYPAPTLIASGVAAATYGDSTHVPQIAFDAKGRATSASNVAITASGIGALNNLVVGGTGETGNANFDGTNTFSFATKSGNNYFLNNPAALGVVKITTGCTFSTNGQHCSIQQWDIRTGFYGKLKSTGNNATAASGSGGTAAGAQVSAIGTNYFAAGMGITTSNGTAGVATGNSGAPGSATASGITWGGASGIGGRGGNGSVGTSGAVVAPAAVAYAPPVMMPFYPLKTEANAVFSAGQAGGGGSGGTGDGTNFGGGGGGGGSGGGGQHIYIGEIITDGSTPAGTCDCSGGNGGAGFSPTLGNTGGGGGGGGGGAGATVLILGKLTGPSVAGFFTANGGNGANGGTGHGTGATAVGGDGGQAGRIYFFNCATNIWTIDTTQPAGSAHSGATGGAGGTVSATLS